MEKKLTVRNLAQRIAFLGELEGQISDGNWENARPDDHWIVWMLKANEVVIGDSVGRNFGAKRTRYNFADEDLLNVVGERMVFLIKGAMLYPDIVIPMVEDGEHWDWPESVADYTSDQSRYENSEYHKELSGRRKAAGITLDVLEQVEESNVYTMTDLRRDMRDLTSIVTSWSEGPIQPAFDGPKYPEISIELDLAGEKGNVYNIMGRVVNALRKNGATEQEVHLFRNEAKSGDYNDFLATIKRWVSVDEDEEDEDWDSEGEGNQLGAGDNGAMWDEEDDEDAEEDVLNDLLDIDDED